MRTIGARVVTTVFMSLLLALVAGVPAAAQRGIVSCQVTMSNCTGGPGSITCTLHRSEGGGNTMDPSCVTAVEYNASCNVAATQTFRFAFSAMQTGPNPSCQWSCSACPSVTFDTMSGLPVELLEFEVREPASEGSDDTAEEEDSETAG